MPAVRLVGVARLDVVDALGLGCGVGAVVGEVVALRFAMRKCIAEVCAVVLACVRETELGVEEVVCLFFQPRASCRRAQARRYRWNLLL